MMACVGGIPLVVLIPRATRGMSCVQDGGVWRTLDRSLAFAAAGLRNTDFERASALVNFVIRVRR